jgi:hypothetical protein
VNNGILFFLSSLKERRENDSGRLLKKKVEDKGDCSNLEKTVTLRSNDSEINFFLKK